MDILDLNYNKTFEDIKHIDENGTEFWYARELMPILQYSNWQNFEKIIDKAKTVTETDKLYNDINEVMSIVEEGGHEVTGLLGGVGLKSKFRMMVDTTGQPIQNTEIGALDRAFVDNGAWDKEVATLIAGDFSQAVYSIRQDITYKVLTEAVIQDPSDGSIMYNLAQDDMVALRVVMRLGWEIPNPINAENETETRFPFASVSPESVSL